jgi:hypothetical protein
MSGLVPVDSRSQHYWQSYHQRYGSGQILAPTGGSIVLAANVADHTLVLTSYSLAMAVSGSPIVAYPTAAIEVVDPAGPTVKARWRIAATDDDPDRWANGSLAFPLEGILLNEVDEIWLTVNDVNVNAFGAVTYRVIATEDILSTTPP